MKMRGLVLSCAIAAALCVSTASAPAKTAGCPCSPCKCSPCTCGGSKSGGGKHHDHHGNDHGSSVGVGGTVDLGRIGHRAAEPDPFAPTNESHAPHTQEKPKTKKIDKNVDTTFERVELTSEKAKELEKPEEDAGSPPGAINVSDEKGESAGSPPPQTQEKEKKKKEKEKKKKKLPKPIQDWVDKKKAADEADQAKGVTERAYKNGRARTKFFEKSPHYQELVVGLEEAQEKANKPGATQADKDKANQAKEELKKFEGELEKDFQKTPEGQKEFEKVREAEKAADKAHAEEKEAGKNIDQATKDSVQKAENEAKGP